ncbi:MAG: hypothetical protein AB1488_05945 [Nitrospirota bacterium]
MVTHKELQELINTAGDGNLFVSLYLNVNPITNPKGDYQIHFKNLLKKELDRIGKQGEKMLREDIRRIEIFLNGNRRDFKKGLTIITSAPVEFWRIYHLSVPVRNELVIDKTPHIKPLTDILDNYQRYAVVLVDKESARIFLIHLGEIEEYTEMFTPDIPGKHKKGGWFALEETRRTRHIEHHITMHLKDVVKVLEGFLPQEYIGRIILGGSHEALLRFRSMLPITIADKVAGTFSAEMFASNQDILKKSMEAIEQIELQKEKELVDEMITRTHKNEYGVLGIDDVLTSLREGKIHKLIFHEGYTTSGLRCINCDFLTVQGVEQCPYCGRVVEPFNYIVDLVVQKAVEQGARVEVIRENERLKSAGNIGAILRF